MRILVTNDDGVSSKGLHALAEAMRRLGTVTVIAPERERGAIGHAVTLHKPLRLIRMDKDVHAVNGTPSDCVLLGVTQLMPKPPSLLVSGINRGLNLGDDVTYSGTVSAALEGTLLGIPSIAVSLEGMESFRFETAAYYAARIAEAVLRHGLPPETLLNVNVPNRTRAAVAGVKVTALSRRQFVDPVIEKIDPRGRKYYWIAGTRVSWDRGKDSDDQAIRQGLVSITPLHMDLTHYGALDNLRTWEQTLQNGVGSVKGPRKAALYTRPRRHARTRPSQAPGRQSR
jgi:5'-nucleotidase